MFALLVQVEVRPELLTEFTEAIARNARLSVEREESCLQFDVAVLEGERTKFVSYEVYTSEGAWLAHRESPHFLEYKKVADRALISRELTRLEPLVAGHLPNLADAL